MKHVLGAQKNRLIETVLWVHTTYVFGSKKENYTQLSRGLLTVDIQMMHVINAFMNVLTTYLKNV